MKKGLTPAIVDLAAIGLAILFTIVMLFLFKLQHVEFEHPLRNKFDETVADITLQNMLRMPVEFQGTRISFGELLVYYAATSDLRLELEIQEFLGDFKSKTGIHIFRFSVGAGQNTKSIDVGETSSDECQQLISSIALLPGIGPLKKEFNEDNEKEVEVLLDYCMS